MSFEHDLTCPISLELLCDPIVTPCCGRAFSRTSLQEHLSNGGLCPICRADINQDFQNFDAKIVARSLNIAAMVDQFKQNLTISVQSPSPHFPSPPPPYSPADASQLDTAAQENDQKEDCESHERNTNEDAGDPEYRCTLTPVTAPNGDILPIAELSIEVDWPKFQGEVCMFIPVIDKSGSMSGRAFDQVKVALFHMLHATLANRNVFTSIVPYSSKAEKILVPRDGSAETARWKAVEAQIQAMHADGGTDFVKAFQMIKTVLLGDGDGQLAQAYEVGSKEYEDQRRLGRQGLLVKGAPAFVTHAIVVFLTDGQDNHHSKMQSKVLVGKLRQCLKGWTKKLTVHTIGFSKDHDFALLDEMRKVGTTPGLFRYADPDDDGDTLCAKLSELAHAIISASSLPLELKFLLPCRGRNRTAHGDPIKLNVDMNEGKGSVAMFVELPSSSSSSASWSFALPSELPIVSSNTDKVVNVPITFENAREHDANLYTRWIECLVEELIREVVNVVATEEKACSSTSFKLKLAFLRQRANFLEIRIQHNDSLLERLSTSKQQLQALLSGGKIDIARLNDATVAKAASTAAAPVVYATNPTGKPAKNAPSTAPVLKSGEHAAKLDSEVAGRQGLGKLHVAVLRGSVDEIKKLMPLVEDVDENGDTPLAIAATIGRLNAAKELLKESKTLNKVNNCGQTPLLLAYERGYWKMVDLLTSHRASLPPDFDCNLLLNLIIGRRFFNTAGRLIATGMAKVQMDVLQSHVPRETLQWVMQKQMEQATDAKAEDSADVALYLRRAVENGMFDLVKSLLGKGAVPTIDLLFECGPHNPRGADVARLLLASGLHPDPVSSSSSSSSSASSSSSSSSSLSSAAESKSGGSHVPLRRCAQNGWVELMEVLLEAKADINAQNRKGNTALWLATSYKHLDCVTTLLNAGADPNIANKKGDVPLINSCQKNQATAVAALLASGAKIRQPHGHNTPVLVCCRLGHSVILNTLLTRLARQGELADELSYFAPIDGFNALLAAAEQNFTECINVLANHGAALEARTGEDNAIIRGATALHLAAYYGRVEATMVLLERKADVNSRSSPEGFTPLHVAVKQNNLLVVRTLKAFGADVLARDSSGRVAASYCSPDSAVRQELEDPVLRFLIAAAQDSNDTASASVVSTCAGLTGCLRPSACVDVDGGDGWTPLMEAVVRENYPFAAALLGVGADIHRRNSNGLSAACWLKLLGQESNLLPPYQLDESEQAQLERLQQMCKTDVRNRMIVDMEIAPGEGKAAPTPANSKSNFERRMDDGVKNVAQVPGAFEYPSASTSCTIVNFLQTLGANQRMYPKGPAHMNAILARARVATIGRACVGDTPLSMQQLFAIFALTADADLFLAVNEAIISGTNSKVFNPYIQLLRHGLEQLPSWQGEVYRRVSTPVSMLQTFKKGNLVQWRGFSCCSENWKNVLPDTTDSKSKSGIIFIIKTKTGRQISHLSSSPEDAEVLLLPGITLRITNWFIADAIALGQPNIRETAYLLTDEALQKATKKGDAVMIELQEEEPDSTVKIHT